MKSRDLLILSIFTLATVVAWIGFELYHVVTTSTITDVQKELILPLDPTFDSEVITQLRQQ